ncbi:MAG: flagellar basal body P-ring formation chaperone FlgA [Alphaproteobacteria bacterium]
MMKRIALALGLVLATATSAMAEKAPVALPASLHANVEVHGAYVRLGDLFDGAGAYADRPVVQAPEPGKRTTLDAVWLYKVARAYGVQWQPLSRSDRAVVERASQTVDGGRILEEVRAALAAKGVPADAEVAFNQGGGELHVAAGAEPDITVESVTFDERNRRFNATVVIQSGTSDTKRQRLAGRVFNTVEIPVLSRGLKKGEVIALKDVRWVKVRSDDVRQDVVTDADQLLGLTPTRFIRDGVPLRSPDLQKPILVEKGAQVTMILKTPMMSLTVRGQALEDGARNDSIRVQNTASNKSVLARVIDVNVVSVQAGTSVAALD